MVPRWCLVPLVLALWASSCDATTDSTRFLLSAPRLLHAGQLEKVWVTVVGRSSGGSVSLVRADNASEVLSSVNFRGDAGPIVSVLLKVPGSLLGPATLQVTLGGTVRAAEVEVVPSRPLTFIETDRPWYKPGDLVRIRLLLLQHELRPVTAGVSEVWVESPVGSRMAQWRAVQTSYGMAQLELQLDEEPIMGTWKIKLKADEAAVVVTRTFEVREFVLPKFEVVVSPPPFVTHEASALQWSVCAKYSFGKPVVGSVSLNVTLETPHFHWYGPRADNTPVINMTGQSDRAGCRIFELGPEQLTGLREGHAVSLSAVAAVTEAGTGTVQGAAVKSPVHRSDVRLEFEESPAFFRPYLPYHVTVRVTRRDGSPVSEQAVRVVLKLKKSSQEPWTQSWNLPKNDARNLSSDVDGLVRFLVPPQTREITTLYIEASSQSGGHDVYQQHEARQWISPSDSHVQLVSSTSSPVDCDSPLPMDVLYTFNRNETRSITFFYLVQSRGDVLRQASHVEAVREAKVRQEIRASNSTLGKLPGQDKLQSVGRWRLKMSVTADMAPSSQLVVFYFREDGEVVAASTKIRVQQCLQNKVTARFTQAQAQPGARVTLQVAPSSRSLCAISGVDRAVSFLGGERAISRAKVFAELAAFDVPPAPTDDTHCFRAEQQGGRGRRSVLMPFSSALGNTKQAFNEAGLVVLSNLEVDPGPCHGNPDSACNPCPENIWRKSWRFLARGGGGEFDEMDGLMAMPRMVSAALPGPPMMKSETSNHETNEVEVPAVEMRTFFPETWLWQLEEFSSQGQNSLSLETPHSVTDWLLSAVCVSAAEGLGIAEATSLRVFKTYFMDFTLPYSVKRGEVLPLKVSLFNYMDHDLPVRLHFSDFSGGELLGPDSHSACLPALASLVHEFRLQPSILGHHNISVRASLDQTDDCGPADLPEARDGVTKSVLIKPEGFPEEVTNSIFLCLAEGGEETSLSWQLELPADVVPDSARAFVSVSGDIMGPSLENLDGLVQLPVGCGEQNMVLLVPNIVVLDYLNATGQTSPQVRASALANMRKGYQRELTYRHHDGSFSAFGQSDPEGSMWLTAFVVKAFAQAARHVFVDEQDLQTSAKWVVGRQLENGCFPVVGQVFHKDMKGGLAKGGSPTALSAYVLIALLETGLPLHARVLEDGLLCLRTETAPDLYTLALSTYAMVLMGERPGGQVARQAAEEQLEMLLQRASTTNNELWWEKEGGLALSVEMTAYGILSLARLGGEERLLQALSAVRWISKHRNAQGGFVSTQDTVVALEALSRFTSAVPAVTVDLALEVSTGADWARSFAVQHERRLVVQQATLPAVPADLTFLAKGKGCALVQSSLRYSVRSAALSASFNLSTSVTPVGMDCAELLFEAHLAYTGADEASNMAVLEVDLLSGYEPDKSSLEALRQDPAVELKRWDERHGGVQLYFESLTSREVHLNFVLRRAVLVESPQPALARLFDYYQSEHSVSVSYGLDECLSETPADEAITEEAVVSSDPFAGFTDVDLELAVPEGEEGVPPVFVAAP